MPSHLRTFLSPHLLGSSLHCVQKYRHGVLVLNILYTYATVVYTLYTYSLSWNTHSYVRTVRNMCVEVEECCIGLVRCDVFIVVSSAFMCVLHMQCMYVRMYVHV